MGDHTVVASMILGFRTSVIVNLEVRHDYLFASPLEGVLFRRFQSLLTAVSETLVGVYYGSQRRRMDEVQSMVESDSIVRDIADNMKRIGSHMQDYFATFEHNGNFDASILQNVGRGDLIQVEIACMRQLACICRKELPIDQHGCTGRLYGVIARLLLFSISTYQHPGPVPTTNQLLVDLIAEYECVAVVNDNVRSAVTHNFRLRHPVAHPYILEVVDRVVVRFRDLSVASGRILPAHSDVSLSQSDPVQKDILRNAPQSKKSYCEECWEIFTCCR